MTISLQSLDGIELDAVVHEPLGEMRGQVLQLHGITADMDEGGMFARLAEQLSAAGFMVLRFSFRGHGDSGGADVGATIAGEMLDLQAALNYLDNDRQVDGRHRAQQPPLSVVASSFGAVPLLLSLPLLGRELHSLVLWNPVLDLIQTFIHPTLPWGQVNFGAQIDLLPSRGHLTIDGDFKMGRVLYEEMRRYGQVPRDVFRSTKMPALVVHGDRDGSVSYDIAARAVADRRLTGAETDLHTVVGSDHGFDSREREDQAIRVTVDWLAQQHGS